MSTTTIVSPTPVLFDEARLAVAGFLARYSGPTRRSYATDLRQFFSWCARSTSRSSSEAGPHRAVGPLHGGPRPGPGHHRPATVHRGRLLPDLCSRRALAHSPAEYVRRPKIDTESATLGLDRMELSAFVAQGGGGEPGRPRPCLSARSARPAGVRGLLHRCRGPLARAGTSDRHGPGQGVQAGHHPPSSPSPPGRRPGGGERKAGPLLLTRAGNRLNRHAATRIVQRLAKQAGMTKHISPHSLRHSFITAALDAGVPLRDVQIAARHADPRTTTRYDRARNNLDRHASYIVTAFVAGGA